MPHNASEVITVCWPPPLTRHSLKKNRKCFSYLYLVVLNTPTVQHDTLVILCAHSRYSLGKYFDISDCFHTASMDESFIMHIRKVLSAKLKVISILYTTFQQKNSQNRKDTPLLLHCLLKYTFLNNMFSALQFLIFASNLLSGFFDSHKNAFCIHSMHSSIGDASSTYKIPFAELYQTLLSERRACQNGDETNWLRKKKKKIV